MADTPDTWPEPRKFFCWQPLYENPVQLIYLPNIRKGKSPYGKERKQSDSGGKPGKGPGSEIHTQRRSRGEVQPGHQRAVQRQGRRMAGPDGMAQHRGLAAAGGDRGRVRKEGLQDLY